MRAVSDQDREFVYLVGETPFECCLCVNSWHTHQDRTVLLMPVILVTHSDALATEVAEEVDCIYHWFITPEHFLPCGLSNIKHGAAVPSRQGTVLFPEEKIPGRVDRQHEQHFRRPEADPCSGHVPLRSRVRAPMRRSPLCTSQLALHRAAFEQWMKLGWKLGRRLQLIPAVLVLLSLRMQRVGQDQQRLHRWDFDCMAIALQQGSVGRASFLKELNKNMMEQSEQMEKSALGTSSG